MGSWDGEDAGQGSSWQTKQSHICVRINWEEQLGSETDHTTQGPVWGNKAPKTSGCKNLWELWQLEKLPDTQESLLERPTGS